MRSVLSLAFLLVSLTVFAREVPFNKERLILKIKKGARVPQSEHITKVKNLFGRLYVVYTNNHAALEKELKNSPATEYFERDTLNKRDLGRVVPTPELKQNEGAAGPFNDPKAGRVWSFRDSEDNGVSVNRAYNNRAGRADTQIVVAVVDTGVDYEHEDLKEIMWVNQGEIPGNGIDDDNNGYVDDIHGINTLIRDSNGNATVDMRDTHGHGTHVSGTIAAQQNNNKGIAGIASNVRIMGIRTVPNSSDELDVDVVEAFLYAARHGAKIINCSFGKDHNEGGMAVKETIDHIGSEYGVLVVAAAGNSSRNIDRRLTYPASFESENLLVVASTSSGGGMSYFSNYGQKNVDVAAPGSSIYSTVPGNRYQSMSGTSMASPTTAGVAAEVLGRYPHLGPVELKHVLMETVTKIGRFSGKIASGGRIDLDKAMDFADQL